MISDLERALVQCESEYLEARKSQDPSLFARWARILELRAQLEGGIPTNWGPSPLESYRLSDIPPWFQREKTE